MGLLENVSVSRVIIFHRFYFTYVRLRRYQWPRGLRPGSAAARLLGLGVRIPLGAWISGSCEGCVLLGRSLCVLPITRPEESYRVWCVWVWSWIFDIEVATAHWWLLRHRVCVYTHTYIYIYIYFIYMCVCACVHARALIKSRSVFKL